jgi:hypothetical protein
MSLTTSKRKKDSAVRNFQLNPSEYELFRFTITRPKTLHIRMIATAPVNLLLLDSEDRAQYENGAGESHSYTAAWGRKSDLETTVEVDPGTWYLVVEGSTAPSRGRIEIFQ